MKANGRAPNGAVGPRSACLHETCANLLVGRVRRGTKQTMSRSLGSRLSHSQKATMVAIATPEMKLSASLS
jgi:hypothetical protein